MTCWAVLFCRSSRSAGLLAALLELRHGLEHSPFQSRELLVESPAVFQERLEGHDHTARGRFVLQHHEPHLFRFAGHGFAFLGMTPSWRVALEGCEKGVRHLASAIFFSIELFGSEPDPYSPVSKGLFAWRTSIFWTRPRRHWFASTWPWATFFGRFFLRAGQRFAICVIALSRGRLLEYAARGNEHLGAELNASAPPPAA